MIVGVPKEIKTAEHRVALVPAGAHALRGDGHTVMLEQGAGVGSGFPDDAYRAEGAGKGDVPQVTGLDPTRPVTYETSGVFDSQVSPVSTLRLLA